MTSYLKCKICGAPCLDDQIGQPNPLCPEHEEEQRQREIFMSKGRGQDPETADAEMGIFDEDNIEDRISDGSSDR